MFWLRKKKNNFQLQTLIRGPATKHVTVDDINFVTALECVYVKYKSCASTASKLPD